jgi:uncharacterized protein GlcG (DUF336 family)
MRNLVHTLALASVMAPMSLPAAEEPPVMISVQRMSMEVAEKLARATIAECRAKGLQIAVTVVDRVGIPQVMLRDVLAPDLTVRISDRKAYTALMFNTPTSQLGDRFGGPHSFAKDERLVLSAGGLPISAGGVTLGGVGVSGSPSGETDEECAKAGLDAVTEDLEMAGF